MRIENIRVLRADITTLAVDAVVNSANRSLLGGGGVDRAVHRAAGRELLWACADLGGCEVGKSKITPGFRLPSKYVIHTVAPAWTGGRRGEADLLESAYRSALDLALERDLKSIALSMLSRGIHRYPAEAAAETPKKRAPRAKKADAAAPAEAKAEAPKKRASRAKKAGQ